MSRPELAARLRELATGRVEWRVQDPVERCYCMSFSLRYSSNPKGEAECWLIDHQRRFPDSPHAKYVVAEVRVFTKLEEVALQAADALDSTARPIFVANGGGEGADHG